MRSQVLFRAENIASHLVFLLGVLNSRVPAPYCCLGERSRRAAHGAERSGSPCFSADAAQLGLRDRSDGAQGGPSDGGEKLNAVLAISTARVGDGIPARRSSHIKVAGERKCMFVRMPPPRASLRSLVLHDEHTILFCWQRGRHL